MNPPGQRNPKHWARAAGAGVELAATLVGCCLAGYWLDSKLDSSPWGLVIMAFMGIVGGLYNLIRREVRASFSKTGRKAKSRKSDDADDAGRT